MTKGKKLSHGLVPVLIALGTLATAIIAMRGCSPVDSTQIPHTNNAPNPTPITVSPTPKHSSFIALNLPNGDVLQGAPTGIERQLLGVIQNTAKPAATITWLRFDRLSFEISSPHLKPESRAQLINIAAILKAFPKVNLKIGGYTDNTGDKNTNLKLSGDRASAVRATLLDLGIDKVRLSAAGYGDQSPIGDNNTEEGRVQNRRIALCVTQK